MTSSKKPLTRKRTNPSVRPTARLFLSREGGFVVFQDIRDGPENGGVIKCLTRGTVAVRAQVSHYATSTGPTGGVTARVVVVNVVTVTRLATRIAFPPPDKRL